MDIAEKCMGATFSITGEDGAECFEGVESFKYLGWILHQSDEDWLAVLRNIWRAIQVWGQLGKLLRREGSDPIISEKFYRSVFQAVILFGSEAWVIIAVMMQNIESVHMGFLRQVAGKKERRIEDENWKNEGEDSVLQAEGTKPFRKYINKRQGTVAEWVAL